MKQLEKERELKSDEATTYLTGVKSDSELKRQNLEERQKNVEAVLAEVPWLQSLKLLYILGWFDEIMS